MSALTDLAKMGNFLEEFIDEFQGKAVYVDARLSRTLWCIWEATRELMQEINDLIEEEQMHDSIEYLKADHNG